ncbi:hypothetical protein QMK17_05545 [Rhodococcus sp. G-MC3]|uniref:hypothetical protein n=1 Tax=Rhodococcus sp. G-MC3 TaxID=3046209 RepID=UPI0024BA6361|nr:hypothetical protein [Rhodococcus sp. G-MC3]MDJ0392791.1 hypothetical protein [Rhodococcus sp. G-MC3]
MHTDPDGFVTRTAALAAGYTDNEFTRLAVRGDIRKIAAGIYYPTAKYDALSPTDVHRLRATAAARRLQGHAVSHTSAAVMHGLTMWNTDLSRVHLTAARATGGRRTRETHIHTGSLDELSLTSVGSTPVTSVARTVVDAARIVDLDHAVVLGDSALEKHPITAADLLSIVDQGSRLHNIAAARRAIARMNGLSESAGESLSRLRMAEHGMPEPVLQQRIPHLGFRVDFFWPALRIIGEFDGVSKYGGLAENLALEKEREDALRDEGYQVFRWVWKDLWNFAEVYMRFEKAKARIGAR